MEMELEIQPLSPRERGKELKPFLKERGSGSYGPFSE
jgi:hypothetical protein